MKRYLFLITFLWFQSLFAQRLPAGFPILEERLRFMQLQSDSITESFNLRPLSFQNVLKLDGIPFQEKLGKSQRITVLPSLSTVRITTKRPYGYADYGMIPTPGAQFFISLGLHYQWKGLGITLYPDVVTSQNSSFEGFQGTGNERLDRFRFIYWRRGDNPERYGSGTYSRMSLGQSRISYGFKSFEIAVANENLWWGPGQFNSLTYSNSAPGFPMISLGTRRPVKTFLGNFEVKILSGILNSRRDPATQSDSLNNLYFIKTREKDRYVNAISISYTPKWVKGMHFGAIRTVQTFTDSIGTGFIDVLPVFWGVTKISVGSDLIGESDKGRSQQITLFGRYIHRASRSEIYFELGRRDHAYNWRDYILSPEHARAYIFGFNKLMKLGNSDADFLLRAEITHQQESINRYIRYSGLFGGFSWGMNPSVGGITHHGQPSGVGIGTGSNVQTIEFSRLDKLDKIGFFLERLDNNIDFYYKANYQFTERKPWVDLSFGFLYDKQFRNLILSSKLQVIHARNYQWQLSPASTPEFPKGENLTSVMGQVSVIYFWKHK